MVMRATSRTASKATSHFDGGAIGRGALLGLSVIVPVTVGQEVVLASVDDPCSDPIVFGVFVLILVGFAAAGYRAARAAPGAPYSHGVLAGLGAFVGWLPLKLGKSLIFGGSVISDDCGTDTAVLATVISGVTVALLAISMGIVGGFVASHRRSRER